MSGDDEKCNGKGQDVKCRSKTASKSQRDDDDTSVLNTDECAFEDAAVVVDDGSATYDGSIDPDTGP